jgi:hypothetical protein
MSARVFYQNLSENFAELELHTLFFQSKTHTLFSLQYWKHQFLFSLQEGQELQIWALTTDCEWYLNFKSLFAIP